MKRRVIGIITALALCLGLCPAWALAADTQMLADDGNRKVDLTLLLKEHETRLKPYSVELVTLFDTCGYSFTAPDSTAISVSEEGTLYLTGGGTITSKNGAGVEVLSGGSLYIEDPNLTVSGTYGLYIASGATVELSGGTFTGTKAAIWADDGFADWPEDNYVYFDEKGDEIALAGLTSAKTVVIKQRTQIQWDGNTNTKTVDYDGSRVETDDLPNIKVTPEDAGLDSFIEYSYKKAGDAGFTEGLPTNAGTYTIKASLPEQPGYSAAEASLTLTINKIPANKTVTTAPTALKPTYNGASQQLVTAGVLDNGAAAEGAVIEFATSEGGPYSTNIPTGLNADTTYNVWYRVTDTENYSGVSETKITNVQIQRKEIRPTITLSETSYVYDSSKKEPTVTVKDGQTVIDNDQYTLTWKKAGVKVSELRAAGTYTVTVASTNKNYTFTDATATVEIVAAGQNALSITGQPSVVHYGDEITTLDTTGGSENGDVTWSITAGGGNATIDARSGELKITGVGSVTVKAERAVDNYKTVEDTWTFTVQPKPVTAVLTGVNRTYIANDVTATVKAEVKTSDLVADDDSISIDDPLSGTFEDANVGTNKTITITSANPKVTGTNLNRYVIAYPATATADITPKTVTPVVTLSGNDLKTDNNTTPPTYSYNYDGTEKRPDVTVKDGNDIIPDSNYTVSYSNNKNQGTATVTVTAKEGGNYSFQGRPVSVQFKIENAKAVLNSTPQAKNLTYTGQPQDLVDTGTATGGKVVYSDSEDGEYKETIPQGKDAQTYPVYYKVEGDENHEDTASACVYVTIKPKEITPDIKLSKTSYEYDGNAKTPGVTVKDGNVTIGIVDATNNASEFTVSYQNNKNAGTATVIVSNANGGNYIVNGTKNFTIEKVDPAVNAPAGKTGLPYNGTAQELITRGSSPDGKMVYSLDGKNYSEAVPTGTARGNYTISYKVLGDANHNDLTPTPNSMKVEIIKNTVTNPRIGLSSGSFRYNGSQQKPTVTVRDDNGLLIPEGEYDAAITGGTGDTQAVDVGIYTVTITTPENSNYVINQNNTKTFKITAAEQNPLRITNKPGSVRYGDNSFTLSTVGGSGNGTITWSSEPESVATVDASGLVTIKKAGKVKITATKDGDPNYSSISAEWPFEVLAKPVTVTVKLAQESYVYDRREKTPAVTVTDGSTPIPADNYTTTYENNVNAGTATVTVTANSDGNYAFTAEPKTFVIEPKEITPVIELSPESFVYNGSPHKPEVTVKDGDVEIVNTDDAKEFTVSYKNHTNAGTATVTVRDVDGGNYVLTAEPKTFEIKPKEITPVIELSSGPFVYNGSPHEPAVTVKDGDGDVEIVNTDDAKEFTVSYKNHTNAGTATVTVRDVDGGNYIVREGSADFTIDKATPNITWPTASSITTEQTLKNSNLNGGTARGVDGTVIEGAFAWGDDTIKFETAGEHEAEVKFTPDSTNYKTVIGKVSVPVDPEPDPPEEVDTETSDNNTPENNTSSTSTSSAASAPMQTSVRNGTATSVMSAAAGNKLVKEAVANQSENVVIKPEIAGDVTKAEVSIPAATVNQLKSKTNANLTVSTPIADVTIPNEALDTLSGAGGAVKTVTEQEGNAVTLTLSAGGKAVESVPGGVTLTVPAEDTSPGTVAVLVHDDGTRETIRKSVAGDGKVSVPLDGSATVEIVDNSKKFADVSDESWAAGAVAFSSAHELFNGTSETTFSPDQPMSLGMLATVLYNLEGGSAQSGESGDAWYAAGMSWAEENNITSGDSQLGPNDNVTREQLAVMLWRYAGSPSADGQTLNFTDADQASDYAMEALCWAAANGILNGYGDGQLDPGGLATRAQAAQMLKSFMENT